MSILSLGRPHRAADVSQERWWNWNPARPKIAAAPVETTPTPWWSWNPYRRTARHIEAEGRREGYSRGARDELRAMTRRQRRRSHPIIGLLVSVAAVSAVGFLGLAYETGSFASGGAVIDQKLAEWRADIMGMAGRAGDQGGHAVQTVGQRISAQSQQLSQ